jgi:hypothetical protein
MTKPDFPSTSRADVFGTGDCAELRHLERMVGNVSASRNEFYRVAFAPCPTAEKIADFYPPSRLEWIVIEAAPSNDTGVCLGNDRPRRVAIATPTPSVDSHAAAARSKRGVKAVKHGALSTMPPGRSTLPGRLSQTRRDYRLRLRWRESGGPPVTPSGRKGFGTRLIEGGLAQELDGEVRLDYASAGVICQSPCLSREVNDP